MTLAGRARAAPGFLAAICFSAGLLAGNAAGGLSEPAGAAAAPEGNLGLMVAMSGALTALIAASAVIRRPPGFPSHASPGALSLSALPVLAAHGLLIGWADAREPPELSGRHMCSAAVVGTIVSPPQDRRGRVRFSLKPDRVRVDSLWHSHPHMFLVTVVWGSRDSLRPPLRYGDRVALSGILLLPSPARNPGELDLRQWARANGFSHDFLTRGSAAVRLLGAGDVPFVQARIVGPAREAAVAALEAGYYGQAREFLKGLLLGIREGIEAGTQEAFVNAGVAHILAVSGSNVAVVAAIVLFLLGLIRCPLRYTAIPIALVLLLYMFVTGSQPPVVRATLMALLVIGGRLVQRRASGLNVIGIAALAALIDAPRLLSDAGFQLSFAAVLALVLVYPALDRRILALRLHRRIRTPLVWGLRLAGISFVATLGTLPLSALSFGRLSIVGIIANIPVVPLSGVAVILGAASMTCRWVAPVAAPGFEVVNGLVLDLTLEITRISGGLPWASVDTSTWTVIDVLPIVAGAGAWLAPAGSRSRRALLLASLAALAVIALPARPLTLTGPARAMTVSVIDVGQGDAILVQFPDGVSMLFDTGPASPSFDAGGRVIAPLLRRLGIRRLSYLVLTHPHADHTGGCDGLLRSMPVDTVLLSSWMNLGGRAIPTRRLAAGMAFAPTPDSRAFVLWPPGGRAEGVGVHPLAGGINTANNRSLVLRLVFGEFSILLTGDAEAVVEGPLITSYGSLVRSTVLKAAHHGSSSSGTGQFLRAVRPELAVMSVGSLNRFGHPSPDVVKRLEELGCVVRRTDTEGCVMIRTEGRRWERVEWRR